MKLGDAFFGPVGKGVTEHLYVVATDPQRAPDRVLLVSVTSCKGESDDRACILKVGDHPFIRHDSFAYFADARLVTAAELDQLSRSSLMRVAQPASEALVVRMVEGALRSRETPMKVKRGLRDMGLESPAK